MTLVNELVRVSQSGVALSLATALQNHRALYGVHRQSAATTALWLGALESKAASSYG